MNIILSASFFPHILLQITRLGRLINDIRKNTDDRPLAKRLKNLMKRWKMTVSSSLQSSRSNQPTSESDNRLSQPPPTLNVPAGSLPSLSTEVPCPPPVGRPLQIQLDHSEQPSKSQVSMSTKPLKNGTENTSESTMAQSSFSQPGAWTDPLLHCHVSTLSVPSSQEPLPSTTPPHSSGSLDVDIPAVLSLVVRIPRDRLSSLVCEQTVNHGVTEEQLEQSREEVDTMPSLVVKIPLSLIPHRSAEIHPNSQSVETNTSGIGSGTSSLNISDFSPITPVSGSLDMLPLDRMESDPYLTHSILQPPSTCALQPPSTGVIQPSNCSIVHNFSAGMPSPEPPDSQHSCSMEETCTSNPSRSLDESFSAPSSSTYFSGLTGLNDNDEVVHQTMLDPKGLLAGYHGYFSHNGKWCDWTMSLPSHNDCVDIFPYVYID